MNKIKNMIIIILSVAVLGLSCYLIYDKALSKKDNNNPPETKETEDEVKKILLNTIKTYKLDGLYNEESDTKFTDVPTNGQLYLAYSYNVAVQNNGEYGENMDTTVNKNKMDEYFKKVYGITPTKYKNIICMVDNEALVYYKEMSNNFVHNDNHPGHGYYGAGYMDAYITDYKQENNKYVISLLFMDANLMDGYTVNGEIDTNFDNNYGNLIDENNEEKIIEYFRNHIDNYKNISRYQYTFTKEEGNYYLTSFKIVK